MTLWKRLIIAVIGMVVASFPIGLLWRATFDARIPSAFSGLAGGISVLAPWEFLRSV